MAETEGKEDMKSAKGRIAVVLLALVCLFAGISNGERAAWDCPECGRKGNTGNFCGNCAHPAPEAGPVYAVGDIITFGHYEQDNNLNNGQEAIEWIVLDYNETEKKALLLSRYGLDTKPYHGYGNTNGIWGNCFLRSWLTGKFFRAAFTAEEQQKILKTNVDNSMSQGYSEWDTNGGNDTIDRIFLLSYREAIEEYFKDNESRTCKPTAYAIAQGASVSSSDGNGWWWLRSPGFTPSQATCVGNDGAHYSESLSEESGCVRPALWLNLDS